MSEKLSSSAVSEKEKKQAKKQKARENRLLIKKFEAAKKKKHLPESEYVTSMRNPDNVLEIEDLKTYFYTDGGVVTAVNGVTIDIPANKTVALVGESGCGKSVTSLSVMRLVQGPSGQIVGGQMRFNDDGKAIDLVKAPLSVMQKIRGNKIGMIFQEPMTSLNPVFTIGNQIDETIALHSPELGKKEIKKRTIDMLKLVGIARPEGIYDSYPHELSGGMRQRAMIAMALSCDPKLIIADEPTTALDVTIQAQILDLLRKLKDQINASILLITHDLGVVAEMADYVVVMYAGRIIEQGTSKDIYKNPKHPYTIGLLKSKLALGRSEGNLYSIPGQVPHPIDLPDFCYFSGRCDKCMDVCRKKYPDLLKMSDTHKAACWLYKEGVK